MNQIPDIKFSDIKMLILDVDGVMTDGTIIINHDGSESKRFSVQDGHGIKMWQRSGRKTAIISGRYAEATNKRAEQLGIEYVMQDQKKKLPAFESLLHESGTDCDHVVYIGDDLLDLPLVRRAGFGVAVANAVSDLKDAADYVTKSHGGCGAVREVIELILRQTDDWQNLIERYQV